MTQHDPVAFLQTFLAWQHETHHEYWISPVVGGSWQHLQLFPPPYTTH
jgi:hypothetical protein